MSTTMATTISVRMDDDLEQRLDDYRQSLRFEPNKSDVVREALEEFLDRELADDDAA